MRLIEKGAPDRTKKLQHACALAYLLPILEPLELKASLSQEQIIAMLLKAFSWDQEYSQLEILVELNDGSKIEIIAGEPDTPVDEPETPGDETENPGDETENPGEEDPEEENPDEETEPEEQEEEPGTLPDLAYKKFEVKLKAHHYHQHIKYDLKPKHLKAEVKVPRRERKSSSRTLRQSVSSSPSSAPENQLRHAAAAGCRRALAGLELGQGL